MTRTIVLTTKPRLDPGKNRYLLIYLMHPRDGRIKQYFSAFQKWGNFLAATAFWKSLCQLLRRVLTTS